MGLTETLLKGLIKGKAGLFVEVSGKQAVEIRLEGKEIVLDVKSPVLAMEAFLDQAGKGMLDTVKKLGYRIKVKYHVLEFEL